jgi:hypothetical protein
MNEQRRQILQMLAEGKITADEAERLIDAIEREQPESPPTAAARPKPRPKYLRLVVNWEDDSGGDGPGRSTSGSRCSCCAPGSGSPALSLRRRSPGSTRS